MTHNESVFLLLGPEMGEKEIFIKDLIAKAEKEKKTKAEVYKFFGHDSSCIEITTLLKSRLLFSDYKVVILTGIESINKKDMELLSEYIARPAEDTMLILCSDETRISLGKLEEAIPASNKKIFWELLDHQKRGWVKSYFQKRSVNVEDEAVDFIIEMVENNTKDLKSVCERLEIFFGARNLIRFEDIENFIYHSKEENVFTLFASILKCDFPLALEILDKILLSNDEDPIRILSGILWQVHNLVQFLSLITQGETFERAFQKMAVKSKRQQKLFAEAKEKFSLKDLYKIIQVISQFDTWFRVHNQSVHRILMELFLYKIIKLRKTV
jgi:DNA polymerase-3 subunit delta